MKALIVLAHPEPKSFTAALAHTSQHALRELGYDASLIDLYAAEFDPVSDRRNFLNQYDPNYFKQQTEEAQAAHLSGFSADIAQHQDAVLAADILLLAFPLWWGGFPAIIKGLGRPGIRGRGDVWQWASI